MKPSYLLLPGLMAASTAIAETPVFEEILVTADFYQTGELSLANSVTIIDSEAIAARQAESLDEILGLTPNVNYATGASRGRFLQIRGIGERSEFIEPVNYSVGVLVDGIDFTGISIGATLLDIEQVEVLRGPQGTLYGANALAGLINMVSNGPTETLDGSVGASIGNYETRSVAAAIGGPIGESLGYRLAAQTVRSDGYIENTFLDRDDTDNIDEISARAKLRYESGEDFLVDFTVFYADVDNGYDAFNYESSRQTRSNEPGFDRQETLAAAISPSWKLSNTLALESTLSYADSDIGYAFDEDWRNEDLCVVETCTFGPDGYNSAFDSYARDNQNASIDLRLVSNTDATKWVVGLYYRDQQVDLTRRYDSGFGPDSDIFFTSEYDTTNAAIYGDWSQSIGSALTLSIGARIEQRDTDYGDNGGFGFDTNEDLWGAQFTISYNLTDDQMMYTRIARGYKPGGANSNSSVPAERREYETETMLNYEIGYKAALLDDALQMQVAVFFQDRDDIQTDSAIVTCPGPGQPCTFDDFLTNAATGNNIGVEIQASYLLRERHNFYASAGYLDAEYGSGYINFQHVLADEDNGVGFDMDGRDQPHAPNYQYLVGWKWAVTDAVSTDINVEGKDDFLFGNDHENRSSSYNLLNASLNYAQDNWTVNVWVKNLTDEVYENRGFGTFPNDPRDGYSSFGPYLQLGEPRTFGISGSYSL